jgi:hypothetical protein
MNNLSLYIAIGLTLIIAGVVVYFIYVLRHKRFFFGWNNIKFVIVELVKTFSNIPSIFSSKRIERGLFVLSGLGAIVYYIIANIHKLSSGEIIALSSVLLTCGGYLLKQTQTEKSILDKMTPSVKDSINKAEVAEVAAVTSTQ